VESEKWRVWGGGGDVGACSVVGEEEDEELISSGGSGDLRGTRVRDRLRERPRTLVASASKKFCATGDEGDDG